jgi:hypothetical protein
MTRISSFSLYGCPRCGQIHIKPEYASISIHIPIDLIYALDETKACKGCRYENYFKEYKYLGLRSKLSTKHPKGLELLLRRLIKKPYVEVDVRKLYPMLD